MENLHEQEKVLHQHSRRRIQHLQDLYEIPSLADVKYEEWSRVRLNRLLVDYLLRCGYGDSALALAKEKGIEDLVDLDIFMQCHTIEESLRRRSTAECLAWCADHRPLMKKTNVRRSKSVQASCETGLNFTIEQPRVRAAITAVHRDEAKRADEGGKATSPKICPFSIGVSIPRHTPSRRHIGIFI